MTPLRTGPIGVALRSLGSARWCGSGDLGVLGLADRGRGSGPRRPRAGAAGIVIAAGLPGCRFTVLAVGCQPGRVRPRIRYISTPAGRVAYSTVGAGPVLLCDS